MHIGAIQCQALVTPPEEDERKINGPINTVRLEGKIGDVKKVIYLFMDNHVPVNSQSQCRDFAGTDVAKYIYQTIKNTPRSFS